MEKGKGKEREKADIKEKEIVKRVTKVDDDDDDDDKEKTTAATSPDKETESPLQKDMEAPPTPPKETTVAEDKSNQEDASSTAAAPSNNTRSTSPVGQDIADLVSRFANFIAPLPVPHSAGSGLPTSTTTLSNHPGMEFFRRAAEFIAPPPSSLSAAPSSASASASAPAPMSPCAYTHPATWDVDYISGWRKHASASIPSIPDLSGSQRNSSSATRASSFKVNSPGERDTPFPPAFQFSSTAAKDNDKMMENAPRLSPAEKAMKDALASAERAKLLAERNRRDALLRAQKAKFDADTIAKLDALVSYPFAGKVDYLSSSKAKKGFRFTSVGDSDEDDEDDDVDVEAEREETRKVKSDKNTFNSNFWGSNSRTTSGMPIKTPSIASSNMNIESANKYASLKSSFDKFVNDFNANLADAFGGPVPEFTTSLPKNERKKEDENSTLLFEAEGEKEPSLTNVRDNKKGRDDNTGELPSHNATCDICDQWIVGTRYKCFTCPDW